MKITSIEKQKIEVIKDIICNKCGLTCHPKDSPEGEFYGLIEQTIVAGYFSVALDDTTSYTFSLCENCLKSLFDKFTHCPNTNVE